MKNYDPNRKVWVLYHEDTGTYFGRTDTNHIFAFESRDHAVRARRDHSGFGTPFEITLGEILAPVTPGVRGVDTVEIVGPTLLGVRDSISVNQAEESLNG